MKNRSSLPSAQTTKQSNKEVDDIVEKSFRRARELMAQSGYMIPENVKVRVDPQLPFMGYSIPTRQGFNIVVAGGAVQSGMLEGLLMHEMGHIYRISTNHPSHNAEILEEAIQRLGNNLPDYQQKIIHDLLNDIQDLYADDLLFKILQKTPVIGLEQMTEFLQSWVKDEPVESGNPTQDRWANASLMTHNARAIAQMERHQIEDTEGRAGNANHDFLEKASAEIAREFDYFRKTLLNLDENITES
ncbi:MAG TPA: DUF5781 family protein, partial [Candidatus Bathyarchaeia archaeon]|nr:DUF5781 family protein [Candidatus Bathyarchaeia archaeon]